MSCKNLRCKNVRKFVKLSHSEGRCQHEGHQRVSKLFLTVDVILSDKNPGAAKKFFKKQYVLIRPGQMILRENIQNPVKVERKLGRAKYQRSPEQHVYQVR